MTQRDAGFTLIELLLVVALISIISAIAIPRLSLARRAANEASAIASLRHVVSAQEVYSTSCGRGGYAASFIELSTPPPGSTEAFVSAEFWVAVPVKAGYRFTLGAGAGATVTPVDCLGAATQSAYYSTAVPLSVPATGTRSFATSNAHAIWQVVGGAAPTQPFGAPATIVQ
jgi:prepilin-type N-terminal cleavage/methylation domain-containing protein